MSWSLPSITEEEVCPHRLPQRCVQYWLCSSTESTMDAKDSPCLHANNHVSNSAFLHNNCFIAKWFLMHAYKFGIANEAIVLQWAVWIASCDFKQWKKTMGWCTAQWKMLLFCAKTIVKEWRKFELARLKKKKKKKKKKKEKHFGRLATFWFGTFTTLFSATGCVFHHEHSKMNGRVL